MEDPIISEIVASNTSYEKWPNGREVTYNNSNELLDPNSPYYRPEVIGLKTGTSSLGEMCIRDRKYSTETYHEEVIFKFRFMEDAFMNKLLMFEPIDTSLFGDFVLY